jgi:hypothetical protein
MHCIHFVSNAQQLNLGPQCSRWLGVSRAPVKLRREKGTWGSCNWPGHVAAGGARRPVRLQQLGGTWRS